METLLTASPHMLRFILRCTVPILAIGLPAALAAQPAAAPTAAASASPAAVTPVLPASPLGRIGQALLDALNGGDPAAVLRFASAHLGPDARGRSAPVMTAMLVKLQAQSGGLRLERVRPMGSTLRLMTQARHGGRWLGMELEAVPADSTRASIMLYPTDDPGMRRPPAPWATTELSDAEVAQLIVTRVREAVAADRFSGVVLVARGDSILVHETHGMADQSSATPIDRHTRYGTASMGKMLTGVAIAQLVAAGKLRFDDTLARVLPSYPNRELASRVTIAQLLTHTAGVPEPFLSARFDIRRDHGSHERMLQTFADAPAASPAGTFAYSNGNYATLAAVVERSSGLPYDEYVRRNIWARAGVQLGSGRAAVGYARFTEHDPLGVEARRPGTVRPARSCPRVLGFGCGAYAAEELFRFGRALRAGALVTGLPADTLVAGRVAMGGTMKYGYGFYEQRMHGVQVVGHSGSNPDTGYDADMQMVWEGEWTVVVLSNYDAPAGMMLEMPILDLLARQVVARRGRPAPTAVAP